MTPHPRLATAVRLVLLVDGLVFLFSALLNFGLDLQLGALVARYGDPIWQAGVGEVVIALALGAAAIGASARVAWPAWVLSVAGIAFGLSSKRVVGGAHDIHLVLVPLAIVVLVLLVWQWRHDGRDRTLAEAARR